MAPALGCARVRAVHVRAAETVVVHPEVIGLERAGEAARPVRDTDSERSTTAQRGEVEGGIAEGVCAGLRDRVKLRGHAGQRLKAPIETLEVRDDEELLGNRERVERRRIED